LAITPEESAQAASRNAQASTAALEREVALPLPPGVLIAPGEASSAPAHPRCHGGRRKGAADAGRAAILAG